MLSVNQLIGFGVGGGGATDPHRYWRLRSTQAIVYAAPYYESLVIEEIEMRSVATGTAALTADDKTSPPVYGPTPITDESTWSLPAFSSLCIASSGGPAPAYQSRNAFDNEVDVNALWVPDNLGTDYVGAYIGYDFTTPTIIREIIVMPDNAYSGFLGMAVEYSDDKVNWNLSKEYRDMVTGWSGTAFRVFTLF